MKNLIAFIREWFAVFGGRASATAAAFTVRRGVRFADSVEGLGDGGRRRGRLLSRVERHNLSDKHRRRASLDQVARTDHVT